MQLPDLISKPLQTYGTETHLPFLMKNLPSHLRQLELASYSLQLGSLGLIVLLPMRVELFSLIEGVTVLLGLVEGFCWFELGFVLTPLLLLLPAPLLLLPLLVAVLPPMLLLLLLPSIVLLLALVF